MKKFIAMLLTAVMLLGMISVPAFAADPVYVQRLTDDFESGIINSEYWDTGSTLTVDTKATVDSAGNKAAKLCGSDGQSRMYNWNVPGCAQLDILGRAIYEFDVSIDSLTTGSILPFLQLNVLTTDVNANVKQDDYFEMYELLMYDEKTRTINVRQYSNVMAAGTALALGEWAHIRVDADFSTATYRVYVNDNILKSSTGESEFYLYRAQEKVNPADIVKVPMVRIDTYNTSNVFWIDNVDFRVASYDDADGSRVRLTNSSVANGETEVDLAPELSYTFSHELNPDTIKNIALNGDSSYIKSTKLSDDKKTLDIELDRNLAYNTTYTLDFGFTEALYGSLVTDTITFSSLSAESLFFDDFENGTAVDTSMWNIAYDASIGFDPENLENGVLHFIGNAKGTVFNTQPSTKGNLNGDVLIDFKIKVPKSIVTTGQTMTLVNLKDNTATEVATTAIMALWCTKDSTSYQIGFVKDIKNGYQNLKNKITLNYDEWVQISIIADTGRSTYDVYINKTQYVDDYAFPCTFTNDRIDNVEFKGYAGYEFYLDDFKVARNMWMTSGGFYDADGNEIDTINATDTVYKANIINRAPVDEKMTLYLAKYTADGSELKNVEVMPLTVPAGKSLDVEHHFKNLGNEANTSKIKAIYVKNEDSIEPYRTALGFTPEELLPGQN